MQQKYAQKQGDKWHKFEFPEAMQAQRKPSTPAKEEQQTIIISPKNMNQVISLVSFEYTSFSIKFHILEV